MGLLYRCSVMFFYIWLHALHGFKIYGRKNRPRRKPFIVVSNHVSLADPPAVGITFQRFVLSFMAKKELFESRRWGWWFKGTNCIPISRNKNDFSATKEALRRLAKGEAIVIFPEGTRSDNNEMKDPELGVAFLASKANVPVCPIYIDGTYGVLPKGGKYKAWEQVRVFIGPSLDVSSVDPKLERRKRYEVIADKIMKAIAELKKQSEAAGPLKSSRARLMKS